MENRQSSLGDVMAARAISLVAAPMPCLASAPAVQPAIMPAASVGLGTAVRTRSMSGAGVYHVPAVWGLNSKGDDAAADVEVATRPDSADPQIFTHNFTTRSGPPTCSPPV